MLNIFTNQCTMWKLQWGSGHRIFSIFRRKQRFHIVYPIQLSPHDVFSHFSTSNLVTSSCIYSSSSWESGSPWYLFTACVRKNEVKYLIFFRQKKIFWVLGGGMIKITIFQKNQVAGTVFFRPILTLSITPFRIFGIFPLLFPNIFKYFHKFPFLGSLGTSV